MQEFKLFSRKKRIDITISIYTATKKEYKKN